MRSYIHFAAPLALGALLAACGGQEREASAEANGATAEVSTPLPESQVSDTQLQNAAEGAAAAAATPPGRSLGGGHGARRGSGDHRDAEPLTPVRQAAISRISASTASTSPGVLRMLGVSRTWGVA